MLLRSKIVKNQTKMFYLKCKGVEEKSTKGDNNISLCRAMTTNIINYRQKYLCKIIYISTNKAMDLSLMQSTRAKLLQGKLVKRHTKTFYLQCNDAQVGSSEDNNIVAYSVEQQTRA